MRDSIGRISGNNNNVPMLNGPALPMAEIFTKPPLDPVSDHRLTHFFADSHPKPAMIQAVLSEENQEQRGVHLFSTIRDQFELTTFQQPCRLWKGKISNDGQRAFRGCLRSGVQARSTLSRL